MDTVDKLDAWDGVDTRDRWGRWDNLIFHGVHILYLIRCKAFGDKGRGREEMMTRVK